MCISTVFAISLSNFISKDEATTDKIQAIIDATEDFHKKVILLRLFYQQITGDAVQQKYKHILSDDFAQAANRGNLRLYILWMVDPRSEFNQGISKWSNRA